MQSIAAQPPPPYLDDECLPCDIHGAEVRMPSKPAPKVSAKKRALAAKVAEAGASPGDVLIVRGAAVDMPGMPAGVQCWPASGDVVHLTPRELFELGWVRRK